MPVALSKLQYVTKLVSCYFRQLHNYQSPICMSQWGASRFEMASKEINMHLATRYCPV